MTIITLEQLLKELNLDLEWEYAAAVQYTQHAATLHGAEYDSIQKELLVHAQQEMQHAVIVSDHIDFLGGIPTIEVELREISADNVEMLKQDLVGENRAIEAIEEAVNSPLLEVDVSSAHGVLINVTGGNDMTISEAERVAEVVQSKVSPTARIIWGATVDPTLEHTLRVMLVATGVRSKQIVGRRDPAEERARVGVDVIR